jgi:hypothetical protein
LPVDVMPASNGEFVPKPPSHIQRSIMALADQETERVRRKMGMSRRDFVRTAAAYTIGLWAINQVSDTGFGRYAIANNTKSNEACDLEWPGAQMNNLPGEFIFDVQSHHVESDGMWRVTNPGFEAFFAAIWSQAGGVGPQAEADEHWLKGDPSKGINTRDGFTLTRGGREADPMENLSRYHYLKELFLDSSTNMTVLSAVPAAPDLTQPLPIDKAALTVETIRNLAQSERSVMHAFVMPNRGAGGTAASELGGDPVYMAREFEIMEERAVTYKEILRAWKVYTAWGDVPNATGWYFDDPVGEKFLAKVVEISSKYPWVRPNVAVHKGFALPGFDQRAASPRDIGPAAVKNPDVNFIVYHSGYDGGGVGAYPGDTFVNSADRSVHAFIKSLRENGLIAAEFPGGNIPNVYAEIGSTWRSVMGSPSSASHLLGLLVKHVGPKRICWGTDSLWFGSPQAEIVGLRALEMTQEAKDMYGLPYGLEGDVDNPLVQASHPSRTIRNGIFGRNAAAVYGVDADAARNAIACDDVQKIRDGYILNQGTPREMTPMSSNQIIGPRNAQELWKQRADQPWGP